MAISIAICVFCTIVLGTKAVEESRHSTQGLCMDLVQCGRGKHPLVHFVFCQSKRKGRDFFGIRLLRSVCSAKAWPFFGIPAYTRHVDSAGFQNPFAQHITRFLLLGAVQYDVQATKLICGSKKYGLELAAFVLSTCSKPSIFSYSLLEVYPFSRLRHHCLSVNILICQALAWTLFSSVYVHG